MKILFGSLVILFYLNGCVGQDKTCIKDDIANERFHFISQIRNSQKTYIHYDGNVIGEYNDNGLIDKNQAIWKSCTNYLLVMGSDRDGPLKKGDTLEVNILKYDRDTLSLVGTAKGVVLPMTFVKVKR